MMTQYQTMHPSISDYASIDYHPSPLSTSISTSAPTARIMAIEQAGCVAGLLLILYQGLIIDYSVRLLITSGRKMKVFDFEELLHVVFGRRGWLIGFFSIILLLFGVMLTFTIMTVSPTIFLSCAFNLWFISLCAVLPLSCLKSLKQLGWVCMMSVTMLFICWTSAFSISTSPSSSSSSVSVWTFIGSNFFSSFGSISFLFVCHDTSFAIFQSISSPTQTKWNQVARATFLTGLVPTIILAIFGYFAFTNSSEGIQSIILNNFLASDFLVNITRLSIGVSMIVTYPLNLYMCRHVLATHLFAPFSSPSSSSSSSLPISPGMYLGLLLGLFFTLLLIAFMLTNLGHSLVGGFVSSLVFVLLSLAALRSRELDSGRKWLHMDNATPIGLLGLGLLIMTVTTFQALVR